MMAIQVTQMAVPLVANKKQDGLVMGLQVLVLKTPLLVGMGSLILLKLVTMGIHKRRMDVLILVPLKKAIFVPHLILHVHLLVGMANRIIRNNVMITIKILGTVVPQHVQLNPLGLVVLTSLLYVLNLQLVETINLIKMNSVMTLTQILMMDVHQLAN